MILDEIDEMATTLSQVYDNMEQIYAIYIREFPEKSRRLDELRQFRMGDNLSTEGTHDYSGPRHQSSESDLPADQKQIVPHSSFRARDSVLDAEDDRKEEMGFVEVEPDEAPKPPPAWRFTLRQVFRKINQLCHPDKCKRFSYEDTKRLRQCFDEAQVAYQQDDLDKLELIFVRVCYLRDEPSRLSDNIIKSLNKRRMELAQEMHAVSQHKVYMTLQYHINHQYLYAKSYFSAFLDMEIEKAEFEIEKSKLDKEAGAL